jgi:hypothetical protein
MTEFNAVGYCTAAPSAQAASSMLLVEAQNEAKPHDCCSGQFKETR